MGRSTHIITAGTAVHDFVARWLEVIYGNIHLADDDGDGGEGSGGHGGHRGHGVKDWRLLENLPSQGLKNQRVISFHVNRKTHPPIAAQNRHIYQLVSKLVVHHCIHSALTLPGFYAFLRDMTAIQTQYVDAFKIDKRLSAGCNDLITGYWEKVKPSPYDLGNAENFQAAQGIADLVEERSDKSNELKADLPFKKRISADLNHALGSKPTPAPTLSS